jgi:predicted PurR-regulated permease PerM
MKPRWAVLTATLAIVVLVALGLWLLGAPLSAQLDELRAQLPQSWQALRGWLQHTPLGPRVLGWLQTLDQAAPPWAGIAGMAAGAAQALSALALILLLGVYLALDARQYRDGVVRLVPPARRELVAETLDSTGEALTGWLLGQLVTMLMVGAAAAIGLALLGVPLALALGLIAGVLEFIPFFGAIVSGLLAVLVAFAEGPTQALYVAIMFTAVQQIEGNVLVPLVQRWAVQVPPALTVAGVVVFGSLFGIPGIVFGTPLTVVTMVLVKHLYVEHTLERSASRNDP